MLNGRTVLIVEAEFLIAFDFQRMLEQLEAVTLFARSPNEARKHEQLWPTIDLAIVELAYDLEESRPLLDLLQRAGIPIILSTADAQMRQGHPEFPGAPVIVKPMAETDVHRAVVLALAGSIRTSGSAS